MWYYNSMDCIHTTQMIRVEVKLDGNVYCSECNALLHVANVANNNTGFWQSEISFEE